MRDKETSEDVVVVRDGGSAVKWFVVGAVLGAGVALLFAPQSGEETRRAIRRRARELRDYAEDTMDDLGDRFEEGRERVKRTIGDKVESAKDSLQEAKTTAGDVVDAFRGAGGTARDELERRLASARSRRKAAVASDDEEPLA